MDMMKETSGAPAGAPHPLLGERTLLRLAILFADRYQGQPLYKYIVSLLHDRGFAGATVIPCIMGFGARRRLYSELSEISTMDGHLPVIVEAVESQDRIAALLPELDRCIGGGVLTLERAAVRTFRPGTAVAAPAPWSGGPPADHVAATESRLVSNAESDHTVDPEGERTAMHDDPAAGPAPHHFRGFRGQQVLMRIHIGEDDRWHGEPLYMAVVEMLRKRHFAGATVFRGVLGFGAHARLHEPKLFRLSSDMPIVIECVETEANIEAILPELDAMLQQGALVTLEKVFVLLYRPDAPPAGAPTNDWAMDASGGWRRPRGAAPSAAPNQETPEKSGPGDVPPISHG